MVVQFLIDWDGILSSIDLSRDSRERVQLFHLAQLIQKNGCLINSQYVESRLTYWRFKGETSVEWTAALSQFDALYKDFGIKVDVGNKAGRFIDTIAKWKSYLDVTGVNYANCAKDERCILVSKSEPKKRDFFKETNLTDYMQRSSNRCIGWAKLQHFSPATLFDFKAYLEAFVAAAKDYIRIYDPYLSLAFLPVCGKEDGRVKAWRNSLQFLMSVFLRNDKIKAYDIVTSYSKFENWFDNRPTAKLMLDEVICDILKGFVAQRKTSPLISFHFLTEGPKSDFHDRFLVNGRFCFAIGHGCDVCRVDDGFENLLKREKDGAHILGNQWRHPPHLDEQNLSSFNVFYGCSSKAVPCELSIFAPENIDSRGESDMYPQGCYARPFPEIKQSFVMSDNNGNNVVSVPCGQNNITVRVNPLTMQNDF